MLARFVGGGPIAMPTVPQRGRNRHLALPLVVAVVCGALTIASSSDMRWHDALDYRRAAIAGGESWRLATAHLMHLSTAHAVIDIVALLLVAWIFGDRWSWRGQAALGLFAVGAIDAALWGLHPEIERYVGLSGVLHAGFAAGAVRWALAPTDPPSGHRSVAEQRWGAALLAGLAIKLCVESRHQAFWLAGDPFPVVTSAHRWGAMAGLIGGGAASLLSRRRASANARAASRSPRARGR